MEINVHQTYVGLEVTPSQRKKLNEFEFIYKKINYIIVMLTFQNYNNFEK